MAYSDRIKSSFAGFWRNPSLLVVLILEFVGLLVLGVLFTLLSMVMPKTWLSGQPTLALVVMLLIMLVQLFVYLYVHSFFASGFYGMAKNLVQDGSTVFSEFVANAKRYWHEFFWFLFVKSVIFILIGAPLFIAAVSFYGTDPSLVTPDQQTAVLVTLSLFLTLWTVVSFWLLYAKASITFREDGPLKAINTSFKMANARAGASLAALMWVVLTAVVGIALFFLLLLPFDLAYNATQSTTWSVVGDIFYLLFTVVPMSASIIGSLFVFFTYEEITADKPHKTVVKVAKRPVARKK
jgi:hypothetical protein